MISWWELTGFALIISSTHTALQQILPMLMIQIMSNKDILQTLCEMQKYQCDRSSEESHCDRRQSKLFNSK